MTEDEVRKSTWGRPKDTNTTTTEFGTTEQWVYDRGYNALNNLEWATPVENSNYGTRAARIAARNGSKTPIYQIDRDTGIILKEYRSQTVASRETGISVPCINACLRGRQRSAGKFAWQYKSR